MQNILGAPLLNYLRLASSALGPLSGFALYAYIVATFSNKEVVVWSQMLTVIWGIAALMSPFYFAAIASNVCAVQADQRKLRSLLRCLLTVTAVASAISIIFSQISPNLPTLFLCIAIGGLARVSNEFVGVKLGTDGEQIYDTLIRVSPQLVACCLVYAITPESMANVVSILCLSYAAAASVTLFVTRPKSDDQQVVSLKLVLPIYRTNRFGLYQALLSLTVLTLPFQLFIFLSDLTTGATLGILLFLINAGVMTLNICCANHSRDLASLQQSSWSHVKTIIGPPVAIALIVGLGAFIALVVFQRFKGFEIDTFLSLAIFLLIVIELAQTFACSVVNRLNNRHLLKFICSSACVNGMIALLAPNPLIFICGIALSQFLLFAVPAYFFIIKHHQKLEE